MRTTLPPKLAEEIGALRQTEAIAVVQSWLESSPKRTLVLQGGTGAGKTIAAAWAFEFSRIRGRQCIWAYVPDVAAIAEWKVDEWRAFDDAGFIVLDDLGTETERGIEGARRALERLSNVAGGRCVITTNIEIKDVVPRYGPRVKSRIIGEADWVILGGADLRCDPPENEEAARPYDATELERQAAEERRRKREAEDAGRLSSEDIGRLAEDFLRKHEGPATPVQLGVMQSIRAIVDRAAANARPAWEDEVGE